MIQTPLPAIPNSLEGEDIDLSVIIVSWNVRIFLAKCLESLKGERKTLRIQVVVIDNGSRDGTVEHIPAAHPDIEFIAAGENLGFARANNLGLERARGRYVLLLNPDTEVEPGSLSGLVTYLDRHPEVGAAGVQLLNTDGSLQPSCLRFPTPGVTIMNALGLRVLFPRLTAFRKYLMADWDHSEERNVDQLMGAFIMVRSEIVEAVGPLDERFWMYYEEVDWCRRIRQAGWRIRYVPAFRTTHHLSQSARLQAAPRRQSMALRSAGRYFRKHAGFPSALFVSLAVWIGIAGRWLLWWAITPIRLVTERIRGQERTS